MSAAVRSRQPSTATRGRVGRQLGVQRRSARGRRATAGPPRRRRRRPGAAAAPARRVRCVALPSPVAPNTGDARLQHQLGPHAELRPPQHDVGEHARPSAPTCAASPCASAGLIVTFARCRSTRSLSSGPARPRAARASQPRSGTRAARSRRRGPCPASRLESMAITPRSCSSPSAAIVPARTRWRTIVTSPGRRRVEHVHGRHHRAVLGLGVRPERHRRRGRRRQHALAPSEPQQVGRVPAAARPRCGTRARCGRRVTASVSVDREHSFRPSVCIASCTSWRSATSSAQRELRRARRRRPRGS